MTRYLILLLLLLDWTSASARDFWHLTNGPQDTYASVLVADSTGAVYSATGGYGTNLYRSSDGGATWSLRASPGTITSMAINAQGYIWAVYNTPVPNDSTSNGIWRSTDGGLTWASVILRSGRGRAVVVDPSGGVFFANDRSLRYSADNGGVWTDVRPRKDSAAHLANQVQTLAIGPDGSIYAGTLAGMYRSGDKGKTWVLLGAATAPRKVLTLAIALGAIYAGSDSALFKSEDNGATWIKVNAVGREPTSILLRSGNDILVSTADSVIYRSTDGGANWNMLIVSKAWLRQIFATPQGNLLAGSAEYGLFRSVDDGVHWEPSGEGMHTSAVDAVAVGPDETIYAGLGAFVSSSTDRGETWHTVRVDSNAVYIFPIYCLAVAQNGTLFAGASQSGIYRSTDKGMTWQRTITGMKNITVRSLLPLRNGNILAGTENGLYVSTDHGTTWTISTLPDGQFWALSEEADGTILAGYGGGAIKYSTDGGATWTRASAGATSDIQTFALARDGSIYAGTYTSGLFRSTDGGRNWAKILDGPSSILSIQVIGDSDIYLAGYRGIRYSGNRGSTWDSTDVNNGMGRVMVESLARDSVGYIYAGIFRLGVARSVERVAAGVELPTIMSLGGVALDQNVPNPASSTLEIPYILPTSSDVLLKLYDGAMREIATLVNERQEGGEHRVSFDATHLPAGVYYYQLTSGASSTIRRMVIVH